MQVLIHHEGGATGDELERELFILRKLIEKEKVQRIGATPPDLETEKEATQREQSGADPEDFYVCTLSNRQIVYKVWGWLRICPSCSHKQRHHLQCWQPLPLWVTFMR